MLFITCSYTFKPLDDTADKVIFIKTDPGQSEAGLFTLLTRFSRFRGRRSLNGVKIYCCRPAGWVCGEPASCRTSRWGGRRADGSLRGTTGDTKRNRIRGRRSSVRRNSSKTSFNLQSTPKQSTTQNSSFLSWGQLRHYEHVQETMWRNFTVTIIQNPPDSWFCLILTHFVQKSVPVLLCFERAGPLKQH